MNEDIVFQYIKLMLDYIPSWLLLLIGLLIYVRRNPNSLDIIPKYISVAKFGEIELQLREVEQKLAETELHVEDLEVENLRLNQLYANFDVHAPLEELKETRQEMKTLAESLQDIKPALEALKATSDPAEIYAAAEILRAKKDITAFDTIIDALDRIASHSKLQNLRYHTVWTLASAAHRTIIASIKHSNTPKLSYEQLKRAEIVLNKLIENPHVQLDRPDSPDQGIRGPARHALNWIEKGLKKF